MAIPGPGTAISMTTIATEFGGTVPHSLSEYYRGGGLVPNTPGNSAIPTSGQIAMGNFYGSANRVAIALTIAANTDNYDVYTNRGPTYVAGTSDITVTVNPGITVGSTTIPAYAMLVPNAFNPADTVTIINNGVIQGMGGGGGTGGVGRFVPSGSSFAGAPGGAGGSALYVNRPVTVTNNGTLAGGGGGGGGGGGAGYAGGKVQSASSGSGGGGGAGRSGGTAGSGGAATPGGGVAGNTGSAGTSPAGGAGGPQRNNPPANARGGAGGTGGGRGAAGIAGSAGGVNPSPGTGTNAQPGGPGGAAGNYIVGNPFVTYPATGTRQGGVA